MSSRNRFRPIVCDVLESRLVLSQVGLRHPAQVRALGTWQRPQRLAAPPVVIKINAAYDSFVQDYTPARAAYLATLDPASEKADSGAKKAFVDYTRYRVDLLGQELNAAFLQVFRTSKKGGNDSASRYVGLVQRNVNGLLITRNAANQAVIDPSYFRVGTLGRALIDSTPPSNSQPEAAGLYILAQDQAVDASQASVINGFTFVKKTSGQKKT